MATPRKSPATPPGVDANLLADLMKWAKAAGADSAEAFYVHGESLSVAQRLGKREKLEGSEGRDLGCAPSSASARPRSPRPISRPRRCARWSSAPSTWRAPCRRTPTAGIAPAELLATTWPDLDLDDKRRPPSAKTLLALAAEAEDAARAVKGVTNSEGAEASWGRSTMMLVTSNGFSGGYRRSGYSLSCAVLAGEGTGMERDYEWSSAIHFDDLMAAAKVGRNAGRFAVERLNPKKATNARVPVVYDRRLSGGLIGHLAGAINGRGVARGTSFLKDRMGQQIFAKGIRIIDNPHRKRGLGSRPFDGEGLPTKRRAVIDDGVLTTWLLDLASARQLKLDADRHGSHGSPSNLLSREGQALARRADRRHQERPLHHRPDRHGRQRRHRRLQPRRLGLLDRERQEGVAGERPHGRRQPEGHVPEPDAGQRPAVQELDQRADGAN